MGIHFEKKAGTNALIIITSESQIQASFQILHFLQIMLELEPVTKFRKEAFSKLLKDKDKNRFASSNISIYQGGMAPEEILALASLPQEEIYQERQFEDSHLTKFLHSQLLLTKFLLTLLGLTSILLSLLQALLVFTNERRKAILGLQSILTFIMEILIFVKYFQHVQLNRKQLIRRKRANPILQCAKSVFLQVMVLFVHPNILADGVVLQIKQPVYDQTIPLSLNSLLQIIMMGRIYLLFNAIINSSIYLSTRASRMCRIYNTKNYAIFGAKSFFNAHPLHSLSVLYVTLVVVYSRMLSLAQQSNKAFKDYQDFVWCTIITMGTIGYGDYYPGTYIGRAIAFASAISGIIWASLLILTLSQYLTMSSKQSKSHVTLKRLALRELLQKYAEEAVVETSKLGGGGVLASVKQRSQSVKLTLRRLKNTVDSNNLNEEISNLFQSLYGNLMEIYLQQKTYAQALTVLYKQQSENIHDIGFTFAGEIQRIIKDK